LDQDGSAAIEKMKFLSAIPKLRHLEDRRWSIGRCVLRHAALRAATQHDEDFCDPHKIVTLSSQQSWRVEGRTNTCAKPARMPKDMCWGSQLTRPV
jgi:hypothetical protein